VECGEGEGERISRTFGEELGLEDVDVVVGWFDGKRG
jgi:hypothetical protein